MEVTKITVTTVSEMHLLSKMNFKEIPISIDTPSYSDLILAFLELGFVLTLAQKKTHVKPALCNTLDHVIASEIIADCRRQTNMECS